MGSGQRDAARACLQDARLEAEQLGSRRCLWRILHALGQVEADEKEAESLRHTAREIVRFIADRIEQVELRDSFLSLPDVRVVLETE